MLMSSHISLLLVLENKSVVWGAISSNKQRLLIELETHLLVSRIDTDVYAISDRGTKAIERMVSCLNNDLGNTP